MYTLAPTCWTCVHVWESTHWEKAGDWQQVCSAVAPCTWLRGIDQQCVLPPGARSAGPRVLSLDSSGSCALRRRRVEERAAKVHRRTNEHTDTGTYTLPYIANTATQTAAHAFTVASCLVTSFTRLLTAHNPRMIIPRSTVEVKACKKSLFVHVSFHNIPSTKPPQNIPITYPIQS